MVTKQRTSQCDGGLGQDLILLPNPEVFSFYNSVYVGRLSSTLQFEGEEITKQIIPNATIFKTAQMTGVEDRLLNNLAGLAKLLPFIPLVGGGETKLQPVYVRDTADAMIGSLNSKETAGKTYYLGGPEVMS